MLPLLIMGGLALASAVVGASGAIKAGNSAQKQADGEAALYRAQAASRLQKAEFDAETASRKFRRSEGQVEARAAGSNITVESFGDVMNDDAAEAALERAAIRWTAKSESAMLEYQANSAISRGEDAKSASRINAAGAVIGAFSPLATRAYGNSSHQSSGITVDDSRNAYAGNLK